MRKQILNDYKLTASIHTIQIKTPTVIKTVPKRLQPAVKSIIHKDDKHLETSIIFNLNKILGEVYSYSKFEKLFNIFIRAAGIKEYKITRVDMSFDSFDSENYLKYAKLNRYLISMLAVKYHVYNTYRTLHLFSQKQLSVAIKSKYFECENYDKTEESHGTNIACSRFEERSKSWTHNDIRKEFEEHWFKRWDAALKNYDQTYLRYNDELERIFNEGKNAHPVPFKTIAEFLRQYQDCIFSTAQLVDLLSRFKMIGPDKAKKAADNYKFRNGLECYSKSDLEYAVNEIKRATTAYFDN